MGVKVKVTAAKINICISKNIYKNAELAFSDMYRILSNMYKISGDMYRS
jgi:hypothetical protein